MRQEQLSLRTAIPLFLIVMLDAFSWTVIFPLLPYYAVAFGANLFTLGLLVAVSPVVELLSAPLHRAASKKVGRKPVLVLSQLVMVLGYLVLGFAQTIGMLFAARIIDGIAGANNTVGRRLIRDELSEATRTRAMGLIEAAYSLGFLAGTMVGFLVLRLSDDNYQAVPFVAAGITLVVSVITIVFSKESLPPEKRVSSGLSIPEKARMILSTAQKPLVRFLLVVFFVQMFSFLGFLQFSGLFTLSQIGMNAVSFFFIVVFAFVLIVFIQAGLVGFLSERVVEKWIIIVGLLFLGGGLILASTTPAVQVPWYSKAELEAELSSNEVIAGNIDLYRAFKSELPEEGRGGWLGLSWFSISLMLILLGGGFLTPAINSLLMEAAPEQSESGLLGISNVLNKTVEICAPFVLGMSLWFFGWSAPFFFEGVIILVLMVIFIWKT